ncbi:uncharacterized protein LOC143561533 [Bidens hawaiensis]|uniref:uncharacterized protein LOC143561533 n=1 Tax=Bidens hawaiensis TaxID=980011 RepID=UPI00404A20F4
MESKLHPAVTVTNIKNFIPITLDNETGQYTSWSELFKIHCKAFLVFDHLISDNPAPTESSSKAKEDEPSKPEQPALDYWERIDAIVLQWIYGTISQDLLNTILKKDTTAHAAWTALESLFNDNKATRAVYLKTKFANTRLDNFANMHAYCQELKVISDQLANVDAPVTEEDLVIQLVTGLNEQYEGIGMIIQNTVPFPTFANARSRVTMEEHRKSHQAASAASAAGHALHATATNSSSQSAPDHRSDMSSDRGRGSGWTRGRGHGRNTWGRGRGSGPGYHNSFNNGSGSWHNNSFSTRPNQTNSHQNWVSQSSQHQPWMQQAPYQPNNWPQPPYPYPTPSRPNTNNQPGAGLLGPRPNQAYATAY